MVPTSLFILSFFIIIQHIGALAMQLLGGGPEAICEWTIASKTGGL